MPSIVDYIKEKGGVASSAMLKKAGFAPASIDYAYKQGYIDKLTRGVYCTPNIFDDEYASITYRWKKCILSHGTALYLLGLSDRIPQTIDVTVPHGYNPQELTAAFPQVAIYRVSPDLYPLGKETISDPYGVDVPCYDAERSLADLLKERSRNNADPQLIKDAIGGYFKRGKTDLPKLARMCEALGVRDQLQPYLEVLT